MPTDTPDPTLPENTGNGGTEAIPVTWTTYGWARHNHADWLPITNVRELAIELIRRIDITRELSNAGKEITKEDWLSLKYLYWRWDRLHALRNRRNPQYQPRRLGGG